MGLKETIAEAKDLKLKKVSVKEWNCDVWIGVMSGTVREQWEEQCTTGGLKSLPNFRASYLVRCLYDSEGNRIYKENEWEELGEKSSIVLDRLFDIARKHNRITAEDEELLKKSSLIDPIISSSSNLPSV